MAITQHVLINEKLIPIHVSVEPWRRCFALAPGEALTMIWDACDVPNPVEIEWVDIDSVVFWPTGDLNDMEYRIERKDSWNWRVRARRSGIKSPHRPIISFSRYAWPLPGAVLAKIFSRGAHLP